ncbi:MAG: hypoxanthine phosphoribosyltransferase [Myxococcota bacterium]
MGKAGTDGIDVSDIEVLISEADLERRVREMGEEITRDYAGEKLAIVAVLKGAFVFLSDLVRNIDLPSTVDFLALSSYGDEQETSGVVGMALDLTAPIADRHVLLVEDIVDTGLTMKYLLENLQTRHPRSIKVCTLLHKPARARVEVPIHYKGFTIDDHFVIGYGLDDRQYLRNLPFIGHKIGA